MGQPSHHNQNKFLPFFFRTHSRSSRDPIRSCYFKSSRSKLSPIGQGRTSPYANASNAFVPKFTILRSCIFGTTTSDLWWGPYCCLNHQVSCLRFQLFVYIKVSQTDLQFIWPKNPRIFAVNLPKVCLKRFPLLIQSKKKSIVLWQSIFIHANFHMRL